MNKAFLKNSLLVFISLILILSSPDVLAQTCHEIFKPNRLLSLFSDREIMSGSMSSQTSRALHPSLVQNLLNLKAELVVNHQLAQNHPSRVLIEVQIFKTEVLLEILRLNRSLMRSDLLKIQNDLNLSSQARTIIKRSRLKTFLIKHSKSLAFSFVVFWLIDELIDSLQSDEQTRRVPLSDILKD